LGVRTDTGCPIAGGIGGEICSLVTVGGIGWGPDGRAVVKGVGWGPRDASGDEWARAFARIGLGAGRGIGGDRGRCGCGLCRGMPGEEIGFTVGLVSCSSAVI
jgi:hypothetical protein